MAVIKGVVRSYDMGSDPVRVAGEGQPPEKRRKHEFDKKPKQQKPKKGKR